jgi:hypothetical protein
VLLILLLLAFRRKERARAAWTVALIGSIWLVIGVYALGQKYSGTIGRTELHSNTRVDLNDLDARMIRVMAGDATAHPIDYRDTYEYLVSSKDPAPPDSDVKREHSVRWRVAMWSRCWHCTLDSAPLFGFGFGDNLTALMLPTRAWKDYEDSQRLRPPNRSPHSVHVHLFARLGLVGTVLWFGFMACVAISAVRALWVFRDGETVYEQSAFYDTLTVFGAWVIFLAAATFGVVLEGPFGGIWFWALSGLLLAIKPPAR